MLKTYLPILVSCIVGCAGSSTKFEHVWHGRSADLAAVQTVVALYESPDGAMRRIVEDKLARELAQHAMPAVPSYSVLSGRELEDPELAKAALAAAGYDGVVVIRLIGTETYPGEPETTTWGSSWPSAYEDYVFESPVVRVETTLYSLDGGQILWSARSKTVDAGSTNEVIDEVTSLVAATLQQQGVAIATARR
jgi:hypothetical protein